MPARNTFFSSLVLAGALTGAGCGDDEHGHSHNEQEVTTTVILTFTPEGGGAPVVAEFDDPDGDGGNAPTIDSISLAPGGYDLSVKFENRLQSPPVDITREILDEAEAHQVFFSGSAVSGPASTTPSAPLAQTYADMDAEGLPVGLDNAIMASAGTGDLVVTLCHLPPRNDAAVKTADAAEQFRSGGCASIGGGTDAQVTFPVTVR